MSRFSLQRAAAVTSTITLLAGCGSSQNASLWQPQGSNPLVGDAQRVELNKNDDVLSAQRITEITESFASIADGRRIDMDGYGNPIWQCVDAQILFSNEFLRTGYYTLPRDYPGYALPVFIENYNAGRDDNPSIMPVAGIATFEDGRKIPFHTHFVKPEWIQEEVNSGKNDKPKVLNSGDILIFNFSEAFPQSHIVIFYKYDENGDYIVIEQNGDGHGSGLSIKKYNQNVLLNAGGAIRVIYEGLGRSSSNWTTDLLSLRRSGGRPVRGVML